jgi:hypothetical protein
MGEPQLMSPAALRRGRLSFAARAVYRYSIGWV